MIGCCNELNMGYAADGYARQYGVAVAFVTLNVGGLSLANAVSGAMAEDVPIIVISGGAHTNDYVNDNLVHHSTNQKNKNQCLEVFKQITCKAVRIDQAHNAEA
jgi:TPP-dependent 2-oxoacid decarboxylase